VNYSNAGWMHIAAAGAALALGGLMVLRRKGTPAHRATGLLYVGAMLALNGSALMLYDMTGHFGPFHAGAIFSLACVVLGLAAPIFRGGDWLRRHYRWMGWSYFGLLAAAFAEAMVRVPAFAAHSAARGFEVAIGATVVFSLLGSLFMRLLGRAQRNYSGARGMSSLAISEVHPD
jgi:uncharacterized membrane protein